MRICITRSERNPYSETFIRDQIAGFSRLAEVFTIHSGRLPERKEDGTLLAPRLFWVLHKIVKGIWGRNNYFSHYGLKKFLKENSIDVVLANYGLAGAHLAPVCRALNIPLIVIFHGHDATDKKLVKHYEQKYRALFQYASFIVVVSSDMQQIIVGLGANPDKVKVVPCGVDTEKFRPVDGQKEKIFLGVGRLVAKKGPLFTIRGFHEVWKKHRDARLIMVGAHTSLYDECKQTVRELEMEDAVHFPGILKHDSVREIMEKALAFVQHSIIAPNGDMEGTPVSILEASASGLPVISTRHGGIKEAVVHAKTGFLVNEGDVAGMTSCMLAMIEQPGLSETLGRQGRMHIVENYNQISQIEKLYNLAVHVTH